MFTYPVNDWNCFFVKNNDRLNVINKLIESKKESLKGLQVYPENKYIFRAFDLCPFKDLKVVIIGQDCYHGKNQANGLCFSVNDNIPYPPSLRNIIKECNNDINTKMNHDFTYLANQGVLLLNSSLTVHERLAGSHLDIWEDFTNDVIKYINHNAKSEIIFILWGNYAKNKKKFIDKKHFIIEGTHPSPLSANRGGFFHNNYFSKTNQLLKSLNKKEIEW